MLKNGSVTKTGSLPAAEISSSQSNENSVPKKNVESRDSSVDTTKVGSQQNVIYLWNKGNISAATKYTENVNNQYEDPPDFRPNKVVYPVQKGVPVKGDILLCSGGAFQFRSNENEGGPVAQALSKLGYRLDLSASVFEIGNWICKIG